MRLEELSRRTPESRTPYVLGALAVIGVVAAAWRGTVAWPFGAELVLVVAVAAIAVATWRYVRDRNVTPRARH
jgi:hypothetical protein